MTRKVEVHPYQPEWGSSFTKEAKRLESLFGRELLDIHHIGSTAVEGMAAKPVIDLMPVVADIARIDAHNESMKALGYEPKGEYGISGRRFFIKGRDLRTHHVHIYEKGNPEIERHLIFRDYLMEHPAARERYSQVKQVLAEKYPDDIGAYIKGKERIVKELEHEAFCWRGLIT
ncbi:GrpB family protein [Halobacillus litoralis]|uniref:GrpB family protein n=1 Tax=Halobacillus litoralis TaxID=45668 RepID=UPI001CD69213|nr:GrpB family protein [Halobacillus litoralis]MCA0970191.1 GrpB family protein [Halobacillus litoralis]